jgi:hypothetical protein
MLTREKNAFLKIAIIFLAVIVIIAGITIFSFAAQSDPAPKAGSSSEKAAVVEEKVGLLPVHVNGKYGFIDKTGKIIIHPQFDWARDFKEGLAVVKIGGKYGAIDKTGKVVSKPQFDEYPVFNEGLTPVEIGGNWGYIDKTGKVVINPQFDEVFDFDDGIATVWIGYGLAQKVGYIDKTGKYIWKPTK